MQFNLDTTACKVSLSHDHEIIDVMSIAEFYATFGPGSLGKLMTDRQTKIEEGRRVVKHILSEGDPSTWMD